MGHSSCCVANCRNTSRNSSCKFYRFPTASWKLEQRNLWIAAVKRKNVDGSPWYPKPYDVICSHHFIGGKKSEEQLNPSYAPTIFTSVYRTMKIDESSMLNRYECSMPQRNNEEYILPTQLETIKFEQSLKIDQETQVDMCSNATDCSKTFICNRYIHNETCDVEIQTEILKHKKVINTLEKSCGTLTKIFTNQTTQADNQNFTGFASIHEKKQLVSLAGITSQNFDFLLKRMSTSETGLPVQDRLLIFLMKIKTGLTFSAIGVLFGIHRSTISRIFHNTLKHLVTSTANLVFWPSRDVVQATMPAFFYPDYNSTRIIIDRTELRMDMNSYSNHTKNVTAKLLIAMTPEGFICLKSQATGGAKSDSQMTIESGIIDYLEDGDIVLVDKGFPEIKTTIDESGKKVKIVMPTFMEKKNKFSTEETQETYKNAKIRIHIEKMMQRLQVYQILNKIPHYLFHCIDDIIHICCVLVNLQSSIVSNRRETEQDDDDIDE